MDKTKDVPFEAAMAELEQIVQKMEEGNVPLEEMIRQYETARKLADVCQKKLNGFRQKIEVLTKDTPEGGEWRELPETDDDAGAPETRELF